VSAARSAASALRTPRRILGERGSRVLSRVSARFIVGSPHEDDRTRHARMGGILLLLGSAAGLSVLPFLPERIDRPLALGMAVLCLFVGGGITWLPWHRWPYFALISPLVLAFPVVFTGGLIGGDLDYYALFFPLLFSYCGYTFPPRYTGWLFLLSLLGLSLTTFTDQSPVTVPFVLLGSLLAAVCGVVLSLQRQDQQRAQDSMRQLVQAASALGAPSTRSRSPASSPTTASELLDAYGVAVLLPTAHGDDTVISAAEGCLTAAGAEGQPAHDDLLALLRRGDGSRPELTAPRWAGRPTGSGRTCWSASRCRAGDRERERRRYRARTGRSSASCAHRSGTATTSPSGRWSCWPSRAHGCWNGSSTPRRCSSAAGPTR
jgi:hypothetical protein